MKSSDKKKRGLTLSESFLVIVIVLTVVGVAFVGVTIYRNVTQKNALEDFAALVLKVEKAPDNKMDKADLESAVEELGVINKRVFERKEKSRVLVLKNELLTRQGKFAAAEKAFRKAIEQDRRNYKTYLGMGRMYLKEKKYNDAIKQMNYVQTYLPGGHYAERIEMLYIIAVGMRLEKDHTQAHRYYNKVVKMADERKIENEITRESRKWKVLYDKEGILY